MAKRILIGVTGGIAAYKTPELVRRLRDQGAEVRVVLTAGGAQFVAPLALQAVAGHPVYTHRFEPAGSGMEHIELARWADAVVIAPASADFLAKLAHGLADDLLSTLCLASATPLWVAPAMNQQMWRATAVQANVATLRARGVGFVGPASGAQACGEVGVGRMSEPGEIVSAVADSFGVPVLAGRRVLITAGPTREAIDPVRYISNRSSGKMGYALAAAAVRGGAQVSLVSGPAALDAPANVKFTRVNTARQMYDAVLAQVGECDIFVAAAAVADYRPAQIATKKIKKNAEKLSLSLVRNPDILRVVAARAAPPFCVGFAAETDAVEAHALRKLQDKKLDMIIANAVGEGLHTGFESDQNAVVVVWAEGRREFATMPKTTLAQALMTMIAEHYAAKNPA